MRVAAPEGHGGEISCQMCGLEEEGLGGGGGGADIAAASASHAAMQKPG